MLIREGPIRGRMALCLDSDISELKKCSCVAPVESHKTNPTLCMNWSILTSLVDTPFPHNLEIAGSNPQQLVTPTTEPTPPLSFPSTSPVAISLIWQKAFAVLKTLASPQHWGWLRQARHTHWISQVSMSPQ